MSDSNDGGGNTGSTDSAAPKAEAPAKEQGKSTRESVGGASEVHYGYFSSVRNEKYTGGWDAIWNNKKKKSSPKKTTNKRAAAPITVSLSLEDLPTGIRDGLVAAARAKLKKSRVNYDRRDASGRVDWKIDCTIRR